MGSCTRSAIQSCSELRRHGSGAFRSIKSSAAAGEKEGHRLRSNGGGGGSGSSVSRQSALAQQLAGQLPQGLRFGHGCAMLREEPVALASTSVRTSQRRSRAASWTKSPTTAGQGLGRTCCSAVTNGSTVPQGQPAVEALVGELGALVNLRLHDSNSELLGASRQRLAAAAGPYTIRFEPRKPLERQRIALE
jgi:hypothetical protein